MQSDILSPEGEPFFSPLKTEQARREWLVLNNEQVDSYSLVPPERIIAIDYGYTHHPAVAIIMEQRPDGALEIVAEIRGRFWLWLARHGIFIYLKKPKRDVERMIHKMKVLVQMVQKNA